MSAFENVLLLNNLIGHTIKNIKMVSGRKNDLKCITLLYYVCSKLFVNI
jgi:hypothetical protein